jgi:hypothetical protein
VKYELFLGVYCACSLSTFSATFFGNLDAVEWFLAKLETRAVTNSAISVLEFAAEWGSAEVAKSFLPFLGPRADLTSVLEAATLFHSCAFFHFVVNYAVNMESQLRFLWFLGSHHEWRCRNGLVLAFIGRCFAPSPL